MSEMQRRTIESIPMTRADEGKMVISGKFISFTDTYNVCPSAVETISPDLVIEGDDIRALINHDTTLVLGRTKADTLTITRKDDGIYADIDINPKDTDATNLYARVERGDVSQCSFGFDILDEETEYLEDGVVKWTIKKIRLYEVSVCTFPAYQDTHVDAREAQLETMKKRETETWKLNMTKRLKGED